MKVKLATVFLLLSSLGLGAQSLPDGEITQLGTMTARLIAPTSRYAHGALGDTIEAGGFSVESNGEARRFILPETDVFEDLRVRLHDLDDDGVPEAILIQSHLSKGASIAIYDLSGRVIRRKAQSAYIGQKNRWLNIVGVGNFTGDGKVQIAAVITPHLAGSLRVYDIKGAKLVEIARRDGYTNHVNGTRDLDLATVSDVNGDGVMDITIPRIGGNGLATVTFAGGEARELGN